MPSIGWRDLLHRRLVHLRPGDPLDLLAQRFGGAGDQLVAEFVHLGGAGGVRAGACSAGDKAPRSVMNSMSSHRTTGHPRMFDHPGVLFNVLHDLMLAYLRAANICWRATGSTGLTMWNLNPAACERLRSSSCPQP